MAKRGAFRINKGSKSIPIAFGTKLQAPGKIGRIWHLKLPLRAWEYYWRWEWSMRFICYSKHLPVQN